MVEKNQKKVDAKKQRAYFPVKMGTVSHKSPKWESRNTAKKNLKKKYLTSGNGSDLIESTKGKRGNNYDNALWR